MFLSCSQCIEGIIGGVDYSQNKVNQWTATIVEHSLTQLVKQGKPFKYIGRANTDNAVCSGRLSVDVVHHH